ncbi:MAG: hypothetical protein B7Y70_09015 [Rhizobiales bacterium 35-68-8]|nr:MAG: hypothetical protein B7Y70_09015 [Rhizobiales bacterium 35-68-8]
MPLLPRVSRTVRAAVARLTRSSRAQAVIAALTVILIGTSSLQNAVANGDTRTLALYNNNTKESGTFTFKREGRYDPQALKQLNWFLRDWRHSEPTDMDPELFDLVWEVYRDVGGKEGITVLSGYRSPATNSMLRSRSKGVAEQSQHMRGKAMDFYIPGADLTAIRVVGLRMQRGGVGFYPGSNFVHLDTGSIRHWPRMTHDQLVRVFPDEKTVHIPRDGKPLARYQEALAELEVTQRTVEVASNDAGEGIRKFFASLFSFKKSVDEEEDEAAPPAAAPTRMLTASDRAADQARIAANQGRSGEPQERSGETQVALARPVRMQQEVASAPAPASAPAIRVAAAPLPSARPAEIAAAIITAQAVMAPLPNAPMPLKRPVAPDPIVTASIGPVPLPTVITRGPSEATAARTQVAELTAPRGSAAQALSSQPFATQGFSQGLSGAQGFVSQGFNSEGLVPPGLIAQAPDQTEAVLSYAPSAADMDPARPLTPAMIAAPALQRQRTREVVPFGRLFVAPQMTSESYMKLPELRSFGSFMAPPRVAVASTFSKDPTGGLSTTGFSGEAMASLPVHVFAAPSVRVSQRTR